MNKYIELPKEKIQFNGNTEEEKKANELIFDLTLENDRLQQENKQLKEQLAEDKKVKIENWKPTPDDLLDMLNQELLNQLQQRESIIECLYQGVTLNEKQEKMLDEILFGNKYKGDNNE